MALIHGGQLQQVAEQFNIPLTDWLDLSTGIAPLSYPIPNIPLNVWQQLPQKNDALIKAAKQYYQCNSLLVTNGSQAIIKALPELWRKKNNASTHVYLPEQGYKEHAHAWKNSGYQLHYYTDELPQLHSIQPNSVLVIINPNNPTGTLFSRETVSQYQQAITSLNGLLVLDEAFIDVTPASYSICSLINNSHTLIFRSFGKFFGLAGIRIGFLIADNDWCDIFHQFLGPWQVNGPAQYIAQHALSDTAWQQEQKQQLNTLRKKQEEILWQVFTSEILNDIVGCDLFLTVSFNKNTDAEKFYNLLCRKAVYVRLTDEKDKLRLGIAKACDLKRLLNTCKEVHKKKIVKKRLLTILGDSQ